jgi:hypothetical protein
MEFKNKWIKGPGHLLPGESVSNLNIMASVGSNLGYSELRNLAVQQAPE